MNLLCSSMESVCLFVRLEKSAITHVKLLLVVKLTAPLWLRRALRSALTRVHLTVNLYVKSLAETLHMTHLFYMYFVWLSLSEVLWWWFYSGDIAFLFTSYIVAHWPMTFILILLTILVGIDVTVDLAFSYTLCAVSLTGLHTVTKMFANVK